MYPLLFEINIDSHSLDARPEDSLGVKVLVVSKGKRQSLSNTWALFVYNKHITLTIIKYGSTISWAKQSQGIRRL